MNSLYLLLNLSDSAYNEWNAFSICIAFSIENPVLLCKVYAVPEYCKANVGALDLVLNSGYNFAILLIILTLSDNSGLMHSERKHKKS